MEGREKRKKFLPGAEGGWTPVSPSQHHITLDLLSAAATDDADTYCEVASNIT